MLEKWFKLKENNTTAKTEVMAGITTFMTVSYTHLDVYKRQVFGRRGLRGRVE